jgi:hypothetical protein
MKFEAMAARMQEAEARQAAAAAPAGGPGGKRPGAAKVTSTLDAFLKGKGSPPPGTRCSPATADV